jgi:hypothetical protein
MGAKPSHAIPSNRPESGGADKDMRQEKSGLLEREKNEFAAAQKEKEESRPEDAGNVGGIRQTRDEGERKE